MLYYVRTDCSVCQRRYEYSAVRNSQDAYDEAHADGWFFIHNGDCTHGVTEWFCPDHDVIGENTYIFQCDKDYFCKNQIKVLGRTWEEAKKKAEKAGWLNEDRALWCEGWWCPEHAAAFRESLFANSRMIEALQQLHRDHIDLYGKLPTKDYLTSELHITEQALGIYLDHLQLKVKTA
jgi:hypothetical protein